MMRVGDAAMPRVRLLAAFFHRPQRRRRSASTLLSLATLLVAVTVTDARAGKLPWETFDERLKGTQSIAALDSELLGDRLNLQNGSLSFEVTDVSLRGNNALPVAFTRRYEVINHKDHNGADGMLGDWNVVVPNISGSFAWKWESSGTPGNRCSDQLVPPTPDSDVSLTEFWHGIHIELPGTGGGELLRFDPAKHSKTPIPADGETYRWVTSDHIRVFCLPESSLDNHEGEGFLAVAPDGTRYWFTHMAQYEEPALESLHVTPYSRFTKIFTRRKNVLYATRVMDRFGNSVSYVYSNGPYEPGKLTSIQSSDGRSLSIEYTNGRVSRVRDGSRSWEYAYVTTSGGRASLRNVKLPDKSLWTIDFHLLTDAEIKLPEWGEPSDRSCWRLETPLNLSVKPTGSVTHPSGATGTFTLEIMEHGRSHVPLNCGYVTTSPPGAAPGTGNDPSDDVNLNTISGHSFSLVEKKLESPGPGLAPMIWSYAYDPDISVIKYDGTTFSYPVCMNRPGFSRHLRVVHYDNNGGGHEREAVHRRVQG